MGLVKWRGQLPILFHPPTQLLQLHYVSEKKYVCGIHRYGIKLYAYST